MSVTWSEGRAPEEDHAVRVESRVARISWIPSGTVAGLADVSFEARFTQVDTAPPDELVAGTGQVPVVR
jgi:hypothetical protein